MTIALLGAMPEEVSKLLEYMKIKKEHTWNDFTIYEGELFNKQVIVAKSGVGKVMAAMFTQYLLDNFSIDKIIFTGLAGAINESFEIGDVVVAKATIQYDLDVTNLGFKVGQIPFTDFRFIDCDKELFAIASSYKDPSHSLHTGLILTGDVFVTHSQQKTFSSVFKELDGDAVEMEGASVALVAKVNEIPCIIIRTISDKADGSALVSFNDFLPVASENSFRIIQHILEKI